VSDSFVRLASKDDRETACVWKHMLLNGLFVGNFTNCHGVYIGERLGLAIPGGQFAFAKLTLHVGWEKSYNQKKLSARGNHLE
jgi:hypothetical protein